MVKTQEPPPKKLSSGSNSPASAQIVSSPRPVKKRTSSPRLKDTLSAQSSMTSQTMSSRTESTYSISQSSPRSQDGRPKVIVHMDDMDDQDSTKSQNKKKKLGGSKGSSSKGKKGGPTTPGATKTGSKHRRASLNSSVSSTLGSSRSSMMGDASLEQKDSMVASPKRWPKGKGQDQDLVDVQERIEDDDDTSDQSEEDKLSPLVDPVSVRLQKMDDKAKAATPSSLQSVGTSSFSASYGSISLGGDASLSSSDTFNNSPLGEKASLDASQFTPHKPNLQAQPQKKILKPNPNPNPISWNRRRFNADQTRDNHMNNETASASSVASASTSKWEEPLQFERPPAKPLARTSMSVSSGECSIATFSEDASTGSSDNSLSSHSKRLKEMKSQDKSSRSKNSIESSIIDDSWNQGRMDAMFSVTTMGEEQSEVGKVPTRSYSSWTSSEELPPLQQTQNHWASSGQFTWKQGSLSLADWTSGDDSSSEGEKEHQHTARDKKKAKPRSAFDRDAPWYCGTSDEDDTVHGSDSIRSDSSSVLSTLKKKKAPPKTKDATTNKVPCSEASMSFNDLVQPESLTLKDVEKASKSGRKSEKQQDNSMSLGGLLDNKESSRGKHSSFLSKVDEDAIGEGLEVIMSVDLGQNSTKLKSVRSAVVDDQNSGDLETGSMHDQTRLDVTSKSLRSRFGDFLKIFELAWVRRAVYIGLVVFLICDIILVIVLLLR